jgi:tetratricopeptide (TPR) repeat protein
LLENEGKIKEALKMYTESLEYDPKHYELRKAIGRTQRLLGNHSESIKIFEDLLKSVPISASGNFELAKSYYADGNRNKALEHLEIVLDIWKNADATYKPAIEARKKWSKWNEVN